ncbi:MAG: hypothetical protein ACYTXA_04265 [Nostoc sp.]
MKSLQIGRLEIAAIQTCVERSRNTKPTLRPFDPSLRDPSLRDAARSLLPRSGTASSGHCAARSLQLLRSTASSGQRKLSDRLHWLKTLDFLLVHGG